MAVWTDIEATKSELALILQSEDIDKLLAEPDPNGQTDTLTGLATRRYLVELLA